ncbi:MAG: hypothetical protein Q9217_004050 [Psora testacea]
MPSRTTASNETAVMEESPPMLPGLQFNEPLSWRAGKPIAVAELLRRLQALSKQMRAMEQDENDRDSFTRVAKELASPNLLAHKDRGIRAWTACCLVDILRLCAPDAPYTGQQLKDIFNMLITSILPALADPSNAYNQQHLYVLTSLAQVKSIVLLTDIQDSEKLTTNLFATFFDILAGSNKSCTGDQLGKSVEFQMTAILIIIVDESASLPPEVIDVVVAQFLRIDLHLMDGISGKSKKNAVDERQSTLVLKELPPSYNMAKTICNTCPEKMARHVSQYFNDIIVDSSAASGRKESTKRRRFSEDMDNSDMEVTLGPTEEDLRELRKVHQLLRELWRACPAVLQNVIPQLETELSAENVHLRLLATEAFGDIISGIGAAGSPPPPILNPASYPYVTLSDIQELTSTQNVLTKPSSPQPFSQAYPQAYNSFLSRNHDKSPAIRAAWTTGISRILTTSAGGVGLSQQEEEGLMKDLARMLADADEKVRVAAVRALGTFNLRDIVLKLGAIGGVDKAGSVLGVLSDRVRDRKHSVRMEAMTVLGRLWGVAVGEILTSEEQVIATLGSVPSKILDTYFTNDLDIHALLDHVVFEQLLPLNFPPGKSKAVKLTNGSAYKAKESQSNGDMDTEDIDPDKIRTERILLLVKDLDERAKKVFYAVQGRQLMLARIVTAYLQRCEEYNGGVMDRDEKDIKAHMAKLIENLARGFPDSSKFSEHLWKFAKMHDRRAYQLIRFCMAPESDYRTVVKAIKEFTKRIEQSTSASQDMLSSLMTLLYRVSALIYNRSHVPAIMEFSRIGERHNLTGTAHEMLRDISTRTPEVLKAQVQEICKYLQDEAPSGKRSSDSGAVDNLKACASFANRFEKEVPKDRKFVQAMISFALHGFPPEAAKHAVTVLMTASDKKEFLARELVQKCIKGFEYGLEGFISRLAALSQLMLLAAEQTNHESDAVSEIAIEKILLQARTSLNEPPDGYVWSNTVDEECEAKCWALKILVNRVRSHEDPDTITEVADPVYGVLSKLIKQNGEILPSKGTLPSHKPRLRLLAARLCLKLCTKKTTDAFLSPKIFNQLAVVAQDPVLAVRSSFLQRLKKYVSSSKLPQRFYTIPFLFAFEPSQSLRSDTTTWIRSRANFLYNLRSEQPKSKVGMVMESVFARLLSLLAHHPDYASNTEDLVDFTRYILFYLHAVATEENLSLIYHIAQRVKQSRDAIIPSSEMDDNLYHLSDLAQLTIRKFEEAHNWNIQILPGKATLPRSLFTEIKDHAEALNIAEKNYLPEGVEESVEALVKSSMKAARSQGKKRRSDGDQDGENGRESKKVKSLPIRKGSSSKEKKPRSTTTRTTKPLKKSKARKSDESEAAMPAGERRRSGRVRSGEGAYKERGDEEDDEEMVEGVAEWTYTNEEGEEVADEQDGGGDDDDEEGEEGNEDEDEDEDEVGENEEAAQEDVSPSPQPKSSSSKGKKTSRARKGARRTSRI